MAAHHAATDPGPETGRVERMPFNISFYRDQVMADGVSDIALEPLPRVVYVRDGEVAVNGQTLRAGESAAGWEHTGATSTADLRKRSTPSPSVRRCDLQLS